MVTPSVRSSSFTVTVPVLLLAAVALPSFPSPAAAQERPRGAAPAVRPYEVGSALPPVEDAASVLPLTLADAVEHALDRNPTLEADRLDPRIQELALASAQAARRP